MMKLSSTVRVSKNIKVITQEMHHTDADLMNVASDMNEC